jgi:hypothetical protein
VNKSQIVISIVMSVFIVGCSSSTDKVSNSLDLEKHPQKRSFEWCQNNYSSASVSHKHREVNAKHCDSQARQIYIDAKEKEKQR